MQNIPLELYDTPVIGFSNMIDDAVYALERKFGAHHCNRLNVVVRTTKGTWITGISMKMWDMVWCLYRNLGTDRAGDTCYVGCDHTGFYADGLGVFSYIEHAKVYAK